MSSPPTGTVRTLGAWGAIVPVLLALVAHAGILRAGFVLDEPQLAGRLKDISSFSPRKVFVDAYVQPNRVDRGYRPLAFASLALVQEAAGEPWAQRTVNLVFHAAAGLAVWVLLRELTESSAASTAGACVFAVLPVHTDAVARLTGRGELLGAIFAVLAWAVALRNGRRQSESFALAGLSGGLTMVALFSKDNDAVLLPAVIVLSGLLLGRRIPWISALSTLGAVLGAFAVRALVLENRAGFATPLHNPLRDASILERLFHAPALAGTHALQTIAPIRLAAERTILDAPLPGAAAKACAFVLGVTVIALALIVPITRRRLRLASLGVLSFALLVLPAALMLSPAKHLGVERSAYLPSVGWILVLAGCALACVAKQRMALLWAATGLLCAVLGARTALRYEDWVSGDVARLIPARAAPDWARTLFEGYRALEERATGVLEQAELKAFLEQEAQRLAPLSPGNGWVEALQGNALFNKGKHAEAVESLKKAEALLAAQAPPVRSARLYQLAGEALILLERTADALLSLETHIRLVEAAGEAAEAQAYSRRGLCLAKLERLDEALVDFNRALGIRDDLPEVWNNRGFLRYKRDDLEGAVKDYIKGYEACVKANVATSAQGDSAQVFLRRIADVYREWAQRLHAEGRTEEAKLAMGEAQKYQKEAAKLGQASGTMGSGK